MSSHALTLPEPTSPVRSGWIPGTSAIRFGGDYNPEQWSRETWLEDIRLMREAGVNLVSVGIFSWVLLEPREGEYDFTFLDDLLDLLSGAGIDVDLGTPTAAPPAWFWRAYPHACPVTRDGVTLAFGSRGIVSPSSPEYRRAAAAVAGQLAQRYADHPTVVMWHIHNEYGAPVAESYDDASVANFRDWLKCRYTSIDALNAAWGTTFWGQIYGSFEEIDAPRKSASVSNPAHRLDFKRFSSDALLECYRLERDAIRRHARQPITTNFMASTCRDIDYWRWAEEVDIVSNDHYLTASRLDAHVMLSMDADLTRSLAGGKPWILMEHSTSAVNWQPRNMAKRPGELARNSVAHLARGADAIMFFQFRASRFGAEKFHSAMLPHAGVHSRVWREVVGLGTHLSELDELRGSRVEASVAIVWSTESFWAQDLEWRPSVDLSHRDQIEAFYSTLWRLGVTVDFVHPSQDLSKYAAVFAPSLYLLSDDSAANLRSYVSHGGTLAVSYFSGIVDENDAVPHGPFPGQLRDVLGISIEEFQPLREGAHVTLNSGHEGTVWSDEIVLQGAEVIEAYADGPAAGLPAITRNTLGNGVAWYLSTKLDDADLEDVVRNLLKDVDLAVSPPPSGLERVIRIAEDGARYAIAINHADIDLPLGAGGTDLATGAHQEELRVAAGGIIVVRLDPKGATA
ncbi:MAG TPA: beta-galactosidase [Microbacterium sp.]|uniref:beta-galactosidase n=1 Tax=Microbacterium sp. TaxID=51671 RepID=UPI002C746AF9|nr:beta-galactosidase [Microbacterium sp.]HWI29899.1 beta-galactosidase [Microbacterium sp.]